MRKFLLTIMAFILGMNQVSANEFGAWYEGGFEGDDEVVEALEDEENSVGAIHLEGQFLDGDLLKISVLAEDFESPVLGIAFHLNFDSELLAFLKYEPGKFLETGGDPFYLVTQDGDSKNIVFGETLRQNDSFPVGGGVVAEFYFQIIEEATFDFSFKNGVVSTLDVVRQDLDKVEWQDLSLSKNNDSELVYSSSENHSGGALDSASKFGISGNIFLVIIFGGFVLAVAIIWAKNYRDKRATPYVNFK